MSIGKAVQEATTSLGSKQKAKAVFKFVKQSSEVTHAGTCSQITEHSTGTTPCMPLY